MAKKPPVISEIEARQGNRILATSAMGAAIIILLLMLLVKCHSENKEIIVPAVSGKFEAVKPVNTPISDAKTTNSSRISSKTNQADSSHYQLIANLKAENEKMKADFAKASDSLKLVIYNQAIQLNNFTQTFDDENITATASGIVRGEVQSLKLDYTVKERKIETPKPKETVFRLLGGVEAGNNIGLNDFAVKGNLMFQGRKGNILSASFDTKQRMWIGYNISIFDIKR